MQASCVADAATALARLRAAHADGQPYDLAILDYQMPGMDGLELAHAIKADPVLAPIRMVLLSSVSQRGQENAAQQAGMSAALTKPVRQSHLYNCLMTVMGSAAEPRVVSPVTHRQQSAEIQMHVRVLVAEDNVINQKVAVRLLEKLGCRIDVAANGQEAVDHAGPVCLRCRLDGLPDAGDGWLCCDGGDPPTRGVHEPACADHCHDRQCDAKRP